MLRRHAKSIAVVLLLVFSQKAGLRLWMHHWLHESRNESSSVPGSEKFSFACDCFSEAMLPMQGSDFFRISAPIFVTEPGDVPSSFAPDAQKIYYSLKGPPVLSVCS